MEKEKGQKKIYYYLCKLKMCDTLNYLIDVCTVIK